MKAQLITRAGRKVIEITDVTSSRREYMKESLDEIIGEHNRNIDRLTVRRDYYQGLRALYGDEK